MRTLNPYTPALAKIVSLAVEAHGGQQYGEHPYLVHLMQVDAVLAEFGYTDEKTRMAAYLHDVLENTDLPGSLIMDIAGAEVLQTVEFCTDAEGPSRKIRKELTYARWQERISELRRSGNHETLARNVRVKLADRIANVRSCRASNTALLSMYVGERDSFRNALHIPTLCDPMWAEYDALLQEGV